MKKKTFSLALKFVLGFILMGVLICVCSSLIGYSQFKTVIQRQYNDTAYHCAEVALSYLDMEQLEDYIGKALEYRQGALSEEVRNEIVATEAYQSVRARFFDLRRGMDANDIFCVYVDGEILRQYAGTKENWNPLLYVFDSYEQEEYSYVLGDQSPINPQYIDEALEILRTGQRCETSYFISESDYGYNTSALLPVVVDGEVLAFLGVEIPMSTIESDLRQYVLYAVLIACVLVLLSIALYMVYLYKQVIHPINRVAAEAVSFTENENRISTELEKIKTRDEIENLASGILKMQRDINEYIVSLTAVTAEKERLGAELDVAKNIQASMLPSIFPAFPNRREFDIYASMDPAKEVGGDFYDFFLVDEDRLAMVVADVSGKGIPAALFMVIAKTLLKNCAQSGEEPHTVLEKVNNQLCENNDANMFVTVWLGIYRLSTGELVYANAGHEHPAVYTSGGTYELARGRNGFVLAGIQGMRYTQHTLTLKPGDKLFLYTDGVPEATDAGDNLFGEDRMLAALNECCLSAPEETLRGVRRAVDAFVGEAPQFDDLTMLCLEVKEYGKSV